MTMYKIRNKESQQIFSVTNGWINEDGKSVGHSLEHEEALHIGNKLSLDGIPVRLEKDVAASLFVSSESLHLRKVIPFSLFVLFAFLGTIYAIETGIFDSLISERTTK